MEERALIEKFIEDGFDCDIALRLSDDELMQQLMQSRSVLNKVQQFNEILRVHNVDPSKITTIVRDLIAVSIPAGTKGCIRGNMFNKIIFDKIQKQYGNPKLYEIGRETRPNDIMTDEIPDWWVRNLTTNRIVVGFNQIDLWNGGAQINRGAKYLRMEIEGARHLCVVNDRVILGKPTSKKYAMLRRGMLSGIICFPKQLTQSIETMLQNEVLALA